MRKSSWFLLLSFSFGILGCDAPPAAKTPKTADMNPPAAAEKNAPESKPADPTPTAEFTVTPIDAEGLQAAVDKHPGKVVLVDCWATWCIQCMKDFPHTVKMSQKYADQGLVVMSLSFDDATDADRMAKVKEFLGKQQATFENYISRLDLEGDGATAFDIEDGALPHYKLYDRSGKLLKSITNADPDNPMSHDDLEAIVAEALK